MTAIAGVKLDGEGPAPVHPAEILRSLLQSIPSCTVVQFDRDLRLQLAEGSQLENLAPKSELLSGRPLPDFLAAGVATVVERHFRDVLEGERRCFTLRGTRGAIFEVVAVPLGDGAGGVVGGLAVAWDETERTTTSVELVRRLAQQSAVARLGELAMRRAGVRELMAEACRCVADALGVDVAFIAQHAGDELRIGAAVGCGDEFVGSALDPSCLGAVQAGPVVYDEPPSGLLTDQGVVCGASVIVGEGDAPRGVLGAYARERRGFSPHDIDFLHAVAHVVTGAVEQRHAHEQIRHGALHDALTGLPNLTLLRDRTAGALARLRRGGWRVALLCVDIDRLKVLNESLGHDVGDELLQQVGPRLHAVLRPGDTVARFSGDGFSVLCEGIADEAHAARIADRVVDAFAEPFVIDGEERFVTASVGVALAASGQSPHEPIANAEAAMYMAKDRGRARHELHDAGQRKRVAARMQMEHDLHRAIESDELWVAYQPIVALAGGIAGVEALARWDHPEHGFVAPSDFVPIAEDCGLIGALGQRILRDACRQVARWRADTPMRDLKLSVNLSARQVTTPGLVDAVAQTLTETGLAPDALWLELTEGLLLEDSAFTLESLKELSELGVRLVLDDFGTGYSSLGYLRKFPIEMIKIDRSFIADLGEDGRGGAAIVAAIVGMAQALGMRTVPEGVETQGQLDRLVGLGCDYAQGYHLGRPVPARELEGVLRGGLASRR
jgi:diguanylate cyclase (GGDEF)-like protein